MTQPRGVVLVLCACGPNVGDRMDLSRAVDQLKRHPAVVAVEQHNMVCTPDGQKWLVEVLQAHPGGLSLVVGGCSPREHGETIKTVCRQAGWNPYLMAMVNLREHCAWVTPQKDEATEKAIRMLRAGVARAALQSPLEETRLECSPDVLVVGSGVAGLQAAKLAADAGRQVYLVERDPCLGGRVAQLSELYPKMECASCMLEGLIDEVLHHPQIEVFSNAEMERLAGSHGQFRVTIRQNPRFVDLDACFGCPECMTACPVEVPNAYDAGLAQRKAIFVPYTGALPNVPRVDPDTCLHFQGQDCNACVEACPFGAVDLSQEASVQERDVGAVILATGAHQPGAALATHRVLSTMALERMINSSGPTGGQVLTQGGSPPASVAFLHCNGGQGGRAEQCSAVCCLTLTKQQQLLAEKVPGVRMYDLLWEKSSGGRGALPFLAQRPLGAEQVRLQPGEEIALTQKENGLSITVQGPDQEAPRHQLTVDLLVVSPALTGAVGNDDLALLAGAEVDAAGFFLLAKPSLEPTQSTMEGVLVAGCASGPKDVPASVADGAAAAGKVLSSLVPGRTLDLAPTQALVASDRCSGCKTCMAACSFGAIRFDEEASVALVDPRLCKGCGGCVGRCPSGAMVAQGFSDTQLNAEIKEFLS